MQRKLRIYLADLIHDRHVYNYSVPLNVGYITALVNKRLGKSIETQIFKFPDDLISSMKSAAPDILALSNYDWNVNLNRAFINIAREINPEPTARDLSPKSLQKIFCHTPSFFSRIATWGPHSRTRAQNSVDNVSKSLFFETSAEVSVMLCIHSIFPRISATISFFSNDADLESLPLFARDKIL